MYVREFARYLQVNVKVLQFVLFSETGDSSLTNYTNIVQNYTDTLILQSIN